MTQRPEKFISHLCFRPALGLAASWWIRRCCICCEDMIALMSLKARIVIAALAVCSLLTGTVEAKQNKADRIVVRYVPPGDEKLRPVYDYMRKARALEKMQPLLRPLKLPRILVVEATSCTSTRPTTKTSPPRTNTRTTSRRPTCYGL